MNWGIRIVILYAGFVALILTLVFKASGERVELVTKDYYEQELVHQEKMNAQNRGLGYKDLIEIKTMAEAIQLHFSDALPPMKDTKISFYCPSNSDEDREFVLEASEKTKTISTTNWKKGYYALRVQWNNDGQSVIVEETVFIP